MPGSTPIATIRGIPIRVHFSLIIAFVLLVMQLGPFGVPAGILLFASVLAHELGHSVVAQRLGIQIAAIDLHLLGGAALMTESPDRPADEVMIAAAGPAVSFALGAVFFVLATLTGGALTFASPGFADVLAYTAAVNIGMGVFNLIPALPMDGGRIFRAAMTKRLGALRATRVAAKVARVFAVLFIGGGLLSMSLSLALIGAFVWALAGREEKIAVHREAVRQASKRPIWWDSRFGGPINRGPVIDVTPSSHY